MEKKSLKSLTLNTKKISRLTDYSKISGGNDSFDAICRPDTDIGNGASCDCGTGSCSWWCTFSCPRQ